MSTFPEKFRLVGRTALITGSASGLGWEMARAMGEAGARASLARVAALHALQAAIDARSDRPFPQADLGLDGAAEQMAEAGAEEDEIAALLFWERLLASQRARRG
mgnify:CR=1 FL=1